MAFDGCCCGGGVGYCHGGAWWLQDQCRSSGCWIGVVLVVRLMLGFGRGYGWCWVCFLMGFGDVLVVGGD